MTMYSASDSATSCHRLMKFGFTGVFGNDSGHEFVDKFLCFFLHN